MDSTKILLAVELSLGNLSTNINQAKTIITTFTESINKNTSSQNASNESLKTYSQVLTTTALEINKNKIANDSNLLALKEQNQTLQISIASLKLENSERANLISRLKEQKASITGKTKSDKEEIKSINDKISSLKSEKLSINEQIDLNNKSKISLQEKINLAQKEHSISKEIKTKEIEEAKAYQKVLIQIEQEDLARKKAFAKQVNQEIKNGLRDGYNSAVSNQKASTTTTKTTAADNELKTQIKDIQARTAALKQDKSEIQNNITQLNILKSSIKGNSTEEKELKHNIDSSISSLKNRKIVLDTNINDLHREKLALENNQHALHNENAAIQANISELRRQKEALEQNTRSNNTFISAIKNLAGSFSLSVAAGNLLSKAISSAYAEMTQSIHSAFEEYIKLESKIMAVQGQFGDAVGEYEQLGKRIVSAADEMAKGPLEAADAFKKFMPILDDTTKALEGYKQSQIEATAAHIELSTATKSDINLIKLYGVEVEDLAAVHNQLLKAQKFSNATTEEFFRNLPTVTVRAAQAGISIRQMGVEYSILTNTMKSAPQAATSYAALIQQIEMSTDLKKKVDQLNKSTGSDIKVGASAIREAGGVLEWARKLKEAFELTKDASDNFMKSIKLTQAGKALQGLMAADRPNEDRADKKSLAQRAIEDSKNQTNLLKQMYDKASDSIENRIAGFKNSFSNAWMQFLIKHEKTIKKAMDRIEDVINRLFGWGIQFKNFSVEILNELNDLFIGMDFSKVGNTSIQVMEALAHSAGNLLKSLISDVDVLIKATDYAVAKARSIVEQGNYIGLVVTKGKTAADEYVAFFKEDADAKGAALDLAINKNKIFKAKFAKEFGTFTEPERTKIIHQKPKAEVPKVIKDANKEFVAAVLIKEKPNAVELIDNKKSQQAKKDADLLANFLGQLAVLDEKLKQAAADPGRAKSLEKIEVDWIKATNRVYKALSKTQDSKVIDTGGKILIALTNIKKQDIANTMKKYSEKAKEITDSINNINSDMDNRIKDFIDKKNFTSVSALRDWQEKFNKETNLFDKNGKFNPDNKFEKKLRQDGWSKEDAEKALKTLQTNYKILVQGSQNLFKEVSQDLMDKSINTGNINTLKSGLDLKESQLESLKLKFKGSQEDEIQILRESLPIKQGILSDEFIIKQDEIDKEKIAKKAALEDELDKLTKYGVLKSAIDVQRANREEQIDKETSDKKIKSQIDTDNKKKQLEIETANKIRDINSKNAQEITSIFSSALDNIFPGFSKIFDKIIDKNETLQNSLLKTIGLFTENLKVSQNEAGGIVGHGVSDNIAKLPNVSAEMQQAISEFSKDTSSKMLGEFNLTAGETDAIIKDTAQHSKQFGESIQNASKGATTSTKDFGLEIAAIGIVADQVGKSLGTIWEQAKKQIVSGINSLDDFKDSQLAIAKSMPAGIGFIAELMDLPRQAEKANKAKADSIEQSNFELNQSILQSGEQTTDKQIELANNEYKNSLRLLKDSEKDDVIFANKKTELELKYANDIIKLSKQTANDLINSQSQLEIARLKSGEQTTNTLIEIENKQHQNTLFNLSISAKSQSEYDNKSEEAELAHQDALNKIRNDGFAKAEQMAKDYQASIDILSDTGDSIIKTREAKQQFEKDITDASIYLLSDPSKYGQMLNAAALKLAASLKQIAEKSGKDISSINEKNYNSELSVIEKFYGEKRKKLEQDVQNEIDTIKKKQEKLDAINDTRKQSDDDKQARLKSFNTAVSSNTRSADFYRANPEDFENGDNGNSNTRSQVEQNYDAGLINFEEYSKKKSELGLKQYQYYIDQVSKLSDPKEKQDARDKAAAGEKEYYDFIFDKDKEKVNNEVKAAEKVLVQKKAALAIATEIEKAEIAKLDSAYKTSSGLYKDTFVEATQSWVSLAQEAINNIDLSNLIEKVKNDLAQVKSEAQKITTTSSTARTNTGLYGSDFNSQTSNSIAIPIPGLGTVNISNPGTQYNSTPTQQNGTSDADIARYKIEDANKQRALLGLPLLPVYARGGTTRGTSIAGEAGSENIYNYEDMKDMYSGMKKMVAQANTSNNNFNTNSNKTVVIGSPMFYVSGVDLSNLDGVKKVVSNELNKLKIEINKN